MEFPFFWDTLLTSSIVQHFVANGVQNLILPEQLDAGHPPFFYLYLYIFVLIFGLQLFSVHLAMLPILLLFSWSFIFLLDFFKFSRKEKNLAIVLLFSIPALLTQSFLVSYDIALVALGMASLAFGLRKKYNLFFVFSLLLTSISLRGAIALISIFFILFFIDNNQKHIVKIIAITLFVGILNVVWYVYHYAEVAYFLQANNSWKEHRRLATTEMLLKNIISIGRKLVDFGIIFLLFFNFISIANKKINKQYFIWVIPFLIFSMVFVCFTNPIGHRYYLFVYVLMLLPIVKFLSNKKFVYTISLVVLLLLSHFQIYGNRISNGWDCTLAHFSYFKLKKEFYTIASKRKIDIDSVYTTFPLYASDFQIYWKGNADRCTEIESNSKYILYSNLSNDFEDDLFNKLKKYPAIWSSKHGLCSMTLYKKE